VADDFYDKGSEFDTLGFNDLYYDDNQAFVEMRKFIREAVYRPKGIISSNNRYSAIVLAPDINGDGAEATEYYHVYVHDIHANKRNPLEVEVNKDLSKDQIEKIVALLISSEFNDSQSYVFNPSKTPLNKGDVVEIKYDTVAGGVPSQGRVVSVVGTGVPPGAQGALSFSTTVDVRALAQKTRQKTRLSSLKTSSDDCEKNSIIKGSQINSYIFNYDGEIRHFNYNCKPCNKKIREAAISMRNRIRSTKGKSLWKDKQFEQKIRSIMDSGFAGGKFYPYMFGGVQKYTNPGRYKQPNNIAGILKATGKGFTKDGYFNNYSNLMTTDGTGVFKDGTFDCSGIPAWLAFELGFILGLRGYDAKRSPKTYDKVAWEYGRGSHSQTLYALNFGLDITIEQFAYTPGACVFYVRNSSRGKYGHVAVSAGKGFKKSGNKYKIETYEAMFFQYKTKLATRTFYSLNKRGTRAKHRKDVVVFGIPITFALADQFGFWDR